LLKFVSIVFISLILAFRPLIPVLDYVVNYDYITQELCVNRYEPETLCNGVCYLTNEISKSVDDNSQSQNKTISTKQLDVFYINSFEESQTENPIEIEKSGYFHYRDHYQFIFISSLLKPPLV